MPPSDTRGLRGASLPIGLMLAVTPTVAVLQFRAVALLTVLGFLAAVALHARERRRLPGARGAGLLPWPRPAVLAPALLPMGWLLASAAWSIEPGRAATTAITLGLYILLGAMAARAVAEQPPHRLRAVLRCLGWGLAAGITLALLDHASGNWLRAAVRGMSPAEAPPNLPFGLKPAVSIIAVLLPLALCLPHARPAVLPRALHWALLPAGVLTVLWLPAESAKIAVLAGLAAMGAAWLLGAWVARAAGALLAVAVLAAPLMFSAALPRLPALDAIPPSAAHRVLIWEFVLERIGERPLLGWGGESSRSLPGGKDTFTPAALERFGLGGTVSRAWFEGVRAQRLPLHPHNAPLQIWLELGAVGALLAAGLLLWLGWHGAALHAPAAAGLLASGGVVGMLSYGVWQAWWIGVLLLLAVGLTALARLRATP